jgi:trehalose 6-phosphate synthase
MTLDCVSPLSWATPESRSDSGTAARQGTATGQPDLLFVTNRGPLEHRFDAHGILTAERGAGGVVSGLLCAAEGRRVRWISLAMTDADRAASRTTRYSEDVPGLSGVASRLVDVPAATFRNHYDGFSNRVLWFLQHGLASGDSLSPTRLAAYWHEGYVPANEAAARAVVAELAAHDAGGDAPPVIFHDYHLYLAPGMVRARAPRARLQHFIHIPWPEADAWERLPEVMVRRIYAGLAANDVLGFQTARDVRNFLAGAARYLPGSISWRAETLRWAGREVRVAAYPIAVTPRAVASLATTPQAQAAAEAILGGLGLERGRRLILRVDRVEPTKNIVRGFQAYERLLENEPGLRGTVVFAALLVPSRESLPAYQEEAERVQAAIERINRRFGTRDWQPVVAVYGNDHARALACMRRYDVLLVNPLIDGMNLVAKEGGIVNERDGVIILSTEAGAHTQLAEGVLSVNPRDVAQTARALRTALSLSPTERAALASRVRRVVLRESAGAWLERQLAAFAKATADWVVPAPRPADRRTAAASPAAGRPDLERMLSALEAAGEDIEAFDPLPPFGDAPTFPLPLREGGRDTLPLA